jgi:hypothetical protein
MNRDTVSCGGLVTVTANAHVARWLPASDAVHETIVVPAENPVPDAGVHDVCTGAVPPAVDGAAHVMGIG